MHINILHVQTLADVNAKTPVITRSSGFSGIGMWGHPTTCGCSLCRCFNRVFYLVSIGQTHPGFIGFALAEARTFEADLRDELQRLGPPPVVTSGATGTPSTGEGPPPSQPSKEEVEPKEDKEENKKEGRLNLTPKGAPPAPPKQLIKAEEFQPPKEEKEPEKETRESRTEEEKPRAASSGRNRRGESKERRRGEDRFPRRERSRSRRRGSRSHRRERRSRDRDRKRRKELDSEEERPEGGKEKKRRSEKPPEPPGPPPDRWEDRHWYPREPDHPPPPRQGSGWRGVLPVSDHARWTSSTNKGQVKRGKQELFSRRRDRRR